MNHGKLKLGFIVLGLFTTCESPGPGVSFWPCSPLHLDLTLSKINPIFLNASCYPLSFMVVFLALPAQLRANYTCVLSAPWCAFVALLDASLCCSPLFFHGVSASPCWGTCYLSLPGVRIFIVLSFPATCLSGRHPLDLAARSPGPL